MLKSIALALGCAATALTAATISFDDLPTQKAPAGWTITITGEGTPDWQVIADASAPTPPNILKQVGETPKPSFPLCLKNDSSIKNGFVQMKFKAVSGKIDQAAGVVWRARDKNNYYVCRANALEDNVVLYKVQDGKRKSLEIVGRKGGYVVNENIAPGKWHTLRVEFAGGHAKVLFNGKLLFEVEDNAFAEAGQVGLWTKADSVTLFDDFSFGEK